MGARFHPSRLFHARRPRFHGSRHTVSRVTATCRPRRLASPMRFPLSLPAEMRKRTVGLCHLVHVIALLDGASLAGGGVPEFVASAFSMGTPLRPFAKLTIQRIARAICRSEGTSIGTW